ncbi:unnamed protein product, partial [Urochloa humidicola]
PSIIILLHIGPFHRFWRRQRQRWTRRSSRAGEGRVAAGFAGFSFRRCRLPTGAEGLDAFADAWTVGSTWLLGYQLISRAASARINHLDNFSRSPITRGRKSIAAAEQEAGWSGDLSLPHLPACLPVSSPRVLLHHGSPRAAAAPSVEAMEGF